MKKEKVLRLAGGALLYVALPCFILAVWKAAALAGVIKPYVLPPPEAVVLTGWEFVRDGTLLTHLLASFARVLEGFLIAFTLALALGTAIGLSRRFERFSDALLQIIKPIPPIAWIPLAILWFGIGEASKVYIIAVGAFFPMLVNTVAGIKHIDPRFLELARVYEAPRGRVIWRVILPGALPFIVTGVRLGLSMAWICVVAAELIAANSGIGYMLDDGRNLARPDVVILGMLMIGVVGKLMDDLLRVASKRIVRWR